MTDYRAEASNYDPTDTPLALRLSEGLGPDVRAVERKELTAALDKSGSVVLMDRKGDIVFYAADGKMRVERLGKECDGCIAANLTLAEGVAGAWNTALKLRAALDQKNAEYEDLKQTMHNMTRNHALQLDAARMAGVHSVQEQTAAIVRAALELLEAVEGCEAFPPEKMAAFRRVFGA